MVTARIQSNLETFGYDFAVSQEEKRLQRAGFKNAALIMALTMVNAVYNKA